MEVTEGNSWEIGTMGVMEIDLIEIATGLKDILNEWAVGGEVIPMLDELMMTVVRVGR